ncbi:HEAT repeat domain-containing protein [Chroococcidiopsis sp. CCNUC1]|nr:HEAT repeat domain-containing protein [Chroococcidiopsis sp. CCNUC1]URD51282.1 HEAT repeat domain-containing protein [Chroococcidiopsis sp. CCNUC1]
MVLVAVKTLQHLGEEDAIDALITALQDESTAVQKIAIEAL